VPILTLKTVSSRKAWRRDKLARWVITLGGATVIASVVAIVALIVGVTVPLFRPPRAALVGSAHLPKSLTGNDVLCCGIDLGISADNATGLLWTKGGQLVVVDLCTGKVRGRQQLAPPGKAGGPGLRQVESLSGGKYSLLWSDGAMSLVEVVAGKPGAPAAKASPPSLRTLAVTPAMKGPLPRAAVLRRSEAGATTRAALLPDGTISILRQVAAENMAGDQEVRSSESVLREDCGPDIRVLSMDRDGNTLYAGTKDGVLARWQLKENGEVGPREIARAFPDRRAITALALLLGDVSLAVGDAQGGLSTWFPVKAETGRRLRLAHQLRPHRSAVRQIVASGRNKSLLSLDDEGTLHWDYVTSERSLLSLPAEPDHPWRHVALGQRGDALLAVDAAGALRVWRIDGGYPEVSFHTLFGKVLYEGYDAPAYVWQTTGGEDFEPKLSLVPLVFGTLKGTFYAMLFAVPLSLFGAAYASYFTTPTLRQTIKPVVEIMASVPSVVIGFLVALWLAPIIERWIFAFLISLLTLPLVFVAFLCLWQYLRRMDWTKRVESGYEFLVLVPVLLAGAALAVWLAGPLEARLFAGNFRQWLFQGPLGMRYDQRNNIIIAFGLGFTVIPIIFSIAEDSLSNVPYSMAAASMALGASRWQTFWRVVLPSASPGIFAAIMIGFGRAVGETMIVLMATGNTPILDWSPLNGMRTLSANIAVEIPEAPVGGTLYRVLFLCAVLLFLLTFTVNTAAELVRQHLRKRFGQF
jgi:phosphate transport system permease protein